MLFMSLFFLLSQSPFIGTKNCVSNQTFVINSIDGAVCQNDENYIKHSFEFMMNRKTFYEVVPYNVSRFEEFVCKVNSTQYSNVYVVTDQSHNTIPIVCHVPYLGEFMYTDVEVWTYKNQTNTTKRLRVVDNVREERTEWDRYLNHVQFLRSESMAGLKGDHGSTVLRWNDTSYNPCSQCRKTSNHLIFNNTFKADNNCLLQDARCVYSELQNVNCTSFDGGACFESYPSPPSPPSPPRPSVTFVGLFEFGSIYVSQKFVPSNTDLRCTDFTRNVISGSLRNVRLSSSSGTGYCRWNATGVLTDGHLTSAYENYYLSFIDQQQYVTVSYSI